MTVNNSLLHLLVNKIRESKEFGKMKKRFENKWNNENWGRKAKFSVWLSIRDANTVIDTAQLVPHLENMLYEVNNSKDTIKAKYILGKKTEYFNNIRFIPEGEQVTLDIFMETEFNGIELVYSTILRDVNDFVRHCRYMDGTSYKDIVEDKEVINHNVKVIEHKLEEINIQGTVNRFLSFGKTDDHMIHDTVMAHLAVHYIYEDMGSESHVFTGVEAIKAPGKEAGLIPYDFYYKIRNIFNGNVICEFGINRIPNSTEYNGIPLVELTRLDKDANVLSTDITYLYDPMYRNSIIADDGNSLGYLLKLGRYYAMGDNLHHIDSASRQIYMHPRAKMNTVIDHHMAEARVKHSPFTVYQGKRGKRFAKKLSKSISDFYVVKPEYYDLLHGDRIAAVEELKLYLLDSDSMTRRVRDSFDLDLMYAIIGERWYYPHATAVEEGGEVLLSTLLDNMEEGDKIGPDLELVSVKETEAYVEARLRKTGEPIGVPVATLDLPTKKQLEDYYKLEDKATSDILRGDGNSPTVQLYEERYGDE